MGAVSGAAGGGASHSGGTSGGGGSSSDGGSSSGGAPPGDPGTVTVVMPGANATKVDTRASVKLILDRAAAASDAAAVSITSPGGVAVRATVTVTGSTLVLMPDAPLDMQTTYRVKVAKPLSATPAEWTFTTADGALRDAEELYYHGEDPNEFSRVIAADAAFRGNTALAVYRTVNKVLARRSLGDGVVAERSAPTDADASAHSAPAWQPEETVANAESDHVVATDTTALLRVGMSDAGDAIVVWNAPVDGTGPYSIYASRYSVASKAWSAKPDRLELDTDACAAADGVACGAALPRLSVASNGDALVTWERRAKAAASTAWAAALVNGKWSTARVVSGTDGSTPWAAMNGKGQGAVVWTAHGAGTVATTRLRHFTASTGAWDAERTLSVTAGTASQNPFVVMNDAGTLLAGWSEWPAIAMPVPGQGATRVFWSNATHAGAPGVGPAGNVNDGFEAALSQTNAVLGAWGAPNPNSVSGVAFALTTSDVWPSGVTVSKTVDYVAETVARVDAAGRGLVSWQAGMGKTAPGLYLVRYDGKAPAQWATPSRLTQIETVGPYIGMDESGRAVVTWIPPSNGAMVAAFFD
jgi:hypothetical protein